MIWEQGAWVDGRVGRARAHPVPLSQLDIFHFQINKPESNQKTGRTTSTMKYRVEAVAESSGRSERWRALQAQRGQRNRTLYQGVLTVGKTNPHNVWL